MDQTVVQFHVTISLHHEDKTSVQADMYTRTSQVVFCPSFMLGFVFRCGSLQQWELLTEDEGPLVIANITHRLTFRGR